MKRVLVTGASRGIGRATALRLAEDGFAVMPHAVRNRDAAQEIAAACAARSGQPRQEPLIFDLADRAAVTAAVERDLEANGVYFGVVANAGIAADAPFPVLEADLWDRVIDTDLTGFYNLLKPIVMPMISNRVRGRIVAMSSVSGLAGNRGQVNYSAAKAGIIGAVKALAVELAKRGITVNAVAPGVIATEMAETIEFQEEVRKAIPMRRFGMPEEVAATVSFLFRDEAAYITRQVISVNGGLF
jgi:3-oxoacyl-[acyl-carrier protein] reductase